MKAKDIGIWLHVLVPLLLAGVAMPARAQFVVRDASDDVDTLTISGFIQFRYSATFGGDDEESFTHGFSARRTKLQVAGTAGDGLFDYKVRMAFGASTGVPVLEDGYAGMPVGASGRVQLGQFKAPLLREELVGAAKQAFAERSLVNRIFTQDYIEGVQYQFVGDRVRIRCAVSDGLRTRGTAFDDVDESDFGLTTRAELRLGDASWKDHGTFTAFRGSPSGTVLGVAAHWERDGRTGGTGTDADRITLTGDAGFEGDGWNLHLQGLWRHIALRGGADGNDFAFLANAGVFVEDQTELVARCEGIFPADDPAVLGRPAGDDALYAVSLGFNHYFVPESLAAVLTTDVTVYLTPVADAASLVSSSASVPVLLDDDAGQVALRIQLALSF